MRVLFGAFALALALPCAGQSAPQLFYSDLDSGPATGGPGGGGAYVALYGHGFGAVRGSSTVTVGGAPALGYPLWTDAHVVIQLSLAAHTGAIVAHAPAGASNELPFTVRKGTIHFVSATGRDTGSGTEKKPWATIAKAAASMAPGDITYVLNGVAQTGKDDYNASLAIANSGSPGLPKALIVFPGARAAIGSATGEEYGVRTPAVSGGPFSWWTVAGFTLRGRNEALGLVGVSGWRIVGNDISCPRGDGNAGCVEVALSNNFRFLGNTVHDTSPAGASKAYHSVYFTTDSNHIEVGWNTIEHNRSCRGIQFHSSPDGARSGYNQYDLSVHDNFISGQVCDGINFATIDPSKGRVVAFNNVIEHVGMGPDPPDGEADYACIASPGITNSGEPGRGAAHFYANRLCDCGKRGGPDAGAFAVGRGSPPVALEGNVVALESSEAYFSPTTDPALVQGSGNVLRGAGALPHRFSSGLEAPGKNGSASAGEVCR